MFVYGTLKRGGTNHRFLAGQTFVGEARTAPGFRLYDLGDYPGMVSTRGDREGVVGEVWSIDAECLQELDELEALPIGLYRRERVPLLPPFADYAVEGYIYALPVVGRREVGSEWAI